MGKRRSGGRVGGSRTQRSLGAHRGPLWATLRLVETAQPSGGPWARARIRRRAWHSSPYEGCPRLRLMTSVRAWRTTRPGRDMTPKRTAFSRFLAHSFPKANCFIAEFRLKANVVMAHQAALAPNSPEGQPPTSQVFLQYAMDLFAFAASLPGPPDQLLRVKVPVGHPPKDFVPSSLRSLHDGGQVQRAGPAPAAAGSAAAPGWR